MLYSYPSLPEGFPEGNPCSTLYITNIDPKVKERNLANFFERYGPIHTVKIVREKTSGKSLSYGFVEFVSPVHAEVARAKAQYQRIERREILVMFTSERQKLLQEAKIFVKNIPHSVSVSELHNHFAQKSQNLFVHINTDDKGKRLNFGFVHYINIEDAEEALLKLQDSELKGQKLQLSRWVVKEARQIAQAELRRNLYFRNLPLLKKKVIENSLRTILSQHGEIESMLIKKAPKLNSYYALVSFKDPQAAQIALKELTSNPVALDGSTEPLYVSWYQRKNERKALPNQQLNALYLSNLKENVSEKTIKEEFEAYGKVAKVVLMALEGADHKGDVKCGYVVFEEETSAELALNECGTASNVKRMFAYEPEVELTTYRLTLSDQSKLRNSRRKNSGTHSPHSSVVNEEPYMYWPMPTPYIGNVYPGMYQPYFPMPYYPGMHAPTGFQPMFANGMYMMPQEYMMETQQDYMYLPNDMTSCENQKAKKTKSAISTNIADQETRPNSFGSLSTLDDHCEESGNTESQNSSDELDSLVTKSNNSEKESLEDTGNKTQAKDVKQEEDKGQNKMSCKPKRKYGSFASQRRSLVQ